MTQKEFKRTRTRLKDEADNLKWALWEFLEECDENSNIRETMNQLLDEIESLEPAQKREI